MADSAVPEPGPGAGLAFGTQLDRARKYAGLLATDGVTRGLIGPAEVGRIWDRHLLNCAVVTDLVPDSGELIDIGSGAGLPGIVLAMLRPGLHVVLLEPLLRRASFLTECVAELKLDNIEVTRARAEDVAGTIRSDVATARAVAPMERLVTLAAGVLRPGGTLLAIKGQSAETELAAARKALRRLGVQSAEVLRVGHDRVDPAATVVRVVTGGSVPSKKRGREEQVGARRSRPGMA
jgi:16S rRNA (guanine527-N7)-methyltransferase